MSATSETPQDDDRDEAFLAAGPFDFSRPYCECPDGPCSCGGTWE